MFFGMSKLTSLDLSKFDTLRVTNMTYMFNRTDSGTLSIILNKTPFNSSVRTSNMFGKSPTYTITVNSEADKTLIDKLGYSNVTAIVG